jgi:hypothetical protein
MKTTKSKAYSSASNAKRAAKSAGHTDALISSDAYGYYYEVPAPAAKKPAAKKKATKSKKPTKQAEKVAEKVTKATSVAVAEGTLVGGTGEQAVPLLRKSLVKKPVYVTWDIFDALRADADSKGEKLRRKDAIAHAVNQGIAFYTARTQYQSWKTANKY